MNLDVFGDSFARVLVFGHAVASIVLAGATGHLGWLALARLRGKDVPSPRVLRHLRAIGWCVGAAVLLGLLAYPHYRVQVRGLILDRDFPWASNLFELKEHAAALALPNWVAAFAVEGGPVSAKASAWLSLLLSVFILFALAAGLIVTTVRGV